MDIERAIEFILDQQAKTAEEFTKVAQILDGVTEKLDGVTEKLDGVTETLDGVTETLDRLAEQQVQSEEKHNREIAATDGMLRRAIKLAIREARAERKRRQEMDARLDEKITQLAAAQLITEEKLQNFISSLGRSTNGGSPKQ
jgi:hypothetical protein